MKLGATVASLILGSIFLANAAPLVTIQVNGPGKVISPDLFGTFFEDINYATDGGLYAELIKNRSFKYEATEQPTWNELTSWQLVQRGGGKGAWLLDVNGLISANNPHYRAIYGSD